MVRNGVLSPEISVSFSKGQCGVCFGKLWLDFFFSCPLGTEEGDRATRLVPAKVDTACCRKVVVICLVAVVPLLTFESGEKCFRALQAAVNG